MIFYLATYPRCGSGVLQRAVRKNLGRRTANGYGKGQDGARPTDDPALVWVGDSIFSYVGEQRVVKSPAVPILTPEVRCRLAALPDPLFVKTHDLPFEEWFQGEHVIQMVRQPGASIVSHHALSRDMGKTRTLLDHIRGDCYAGSWSAYHRAWRAVLTPTLRLRYEDIYLDPTPLIPALSAFTGLPVHSWAPQTPAEATAESALRNPGRGIDGWRALVSPEEFALIHELHGEEAAILGYDNSPEGRPNCGPLASARAS